MASNRGGLNAFFDVFGWVGWVGWANDTQPEEVDSHFYIWGENCPTNPTNPTIMLLINGLEVFCSLEQDGPVLDDHLPQAQRLTNSINRQFFIGKDDIINAMKKSMFDSLSQSLARLFSRCSAAPQYRDEFERRLIDMHGVSPDLARLIAEDCHHG